MAGGLLSKVLCCLQALDHAFAVGHRVYLFGSCWWWSADFLGCLTSLPWTVRFCLYNLSCNIRVFCLARAEDFHGIPLISLHFLVCWCSIGYFRLVFFGIHLRLISDQLVVNSPQ